MSYQEAWQEFWQKAWRKACLQTCRLFHPSEEASILENFQKISKCQISCLPDFNIKMAKLFIVLLAVLMFFVVRFSFRSLAPDARSFRDAVVCLSIAIFLLFCVMMVLGLSWTILIFILLKL